MFNQCAEIRGDAERLACFDRVTREMRGAAQPPAGTAAAAPTPSARAQQQRADFGLGAEQQERQAPQRRAQRPASIKEITARVAAVKSLGSGYWAMLLEDGAIWEVAELNYQFRAPRAGERVRVRRGFLGGYLLYAGGQEAIRVTRVS